MISPPSLATAGLIFVSKKSQNLFFPRFQGEPICNTTGKRGELRGIWEASGKHLGSIRETSGRRLGGIWEVGGIWRPSESGGPFSIIKMQSNRHGRPFYRRLAKVGGAKYRKTHGSSEGAQPERTRGRPHQVTRQTARNPTAKSCLGKIRILL